MGNTGSCCTKEEGEGENTFHVDRQFENSKTNAERLEEHLEIIDHIEFSLIDDPTIIQSAVRGYFDRKNIYPQLKEFKKQKTFNLEKRFEVLDKAVEEIQDSRVKDVENQLEILKIIPPDDDHTKILLKPAVKLENGSVYQGG